MSNFELYTKRDYRKRTDAPPTVTIMRGGKFLLGNSAMAMLGDPEFVVFLTDRERQMVAFRKTEGAGTDCYRVRGRGHEVSGAALCRHMGIDTSMSRRYTLTMDDGEACIDLKQPRA